MSTPTDVRNRDQSVDIARGVAIVAIVLGHVWRGMAASGLVTDDELYRLVDHALYFWHLAIFVLVSGLFVRSSVRKRGPTNYLRSRLWLFIYLYVIWSLIQGAVKVASGQLVNSPVSFAEMFSLWVPEGQLWYLPFMAQMTLLAVLLRPWRRGWRVAGLALATAITVLAWGLEGPWVGTRGLALTGFFVLGIVLGAPRMLKVLKVIGPGTAVVAAALLVAAYVALLLLTPAVPPTVAGQLRTPDAVALGVLATVLSSAAVFLLARALTFLPALRVPLAFMGRISLEIFLAHVIAAAGTRIVLQQLGLDNTGIHLAAGTVAGLLAGILLWWLAQRWRPASWLFSPPAIASTR